MRIMRKTTLLLLAAAVAVFAAGCGKQAPDAAPETPPAAEAAPVPAESITLAATGVAPDETVAVVDGNSAPAELLTYQIGYSCNYLDYMLAAYGQDGLDLSGTLPDGRNTADYVREESLAMVKQQLVLENLAEQYGITLSDEEEAELAQQREADIEEYGEDGYRAELYRLGLSEDGYERVMRVGYFYQALLDAYADPASPIYASDEQLAAYAEEQGYITADHILIPTVDLDTQEPLSDEDAAANRALAADLLAQLRESDDPITLFKTLADEYSKDSGRAANPDGYTFAEGRMVDEFDAAARALDEYAISDVVESTYGCHIILRKPLDTAAAAEAVRGEAFDRFFLDEVDKAEMVLSPAAERFDVAAVYDAIVAAQGSEAADGAQENPFAP